MNDNTRSSISGEDHKITWNILIIFLTALMRSSDLYRNAMSQFHKVISHYFVMFVLSHAVDYVRKISKIY